MGGLNDDREAILGSLDQISALSVQTADLVNGIRAAVRRRHHHLRRLTANIDRNRGEIDRAARRCCRSS